MPVTAMNEYGGSISGKYNIRSAGQILAIQPKPESHAMKNTANGQLGLCVLRPDATHIPGTLF